MLPRKQLFFFNKQPRRQFFRRTLGHAWRHGKGWGFLALLLPGLLLLQAGLPLTALASGLNPDNTSFWTRPSYERKMNEVGQKILSANHIPTPILFRMSENSMELDATAESRHHLILVGSALFPMIGSDDELAAVLSHEIAHVISGKSGHLSGEIGFLQVLGTLIFVPEAVLTTVSVGKTCKQRLGRAALQNRESAMDLMGLDLMVKAGYNPTAMEAILREIATDSGNQHWRNRIALAERLQRIHAAITLKYPQALPGQDATPDAPGQDPTRSKPVNTVLLPSPKSANTSGQKEATTASTLKVKASMPAAAKRTAKAGFSPLKADIANESSAPASPGETEAASLATPESTTTRSPVVGSSPKTSDAPAALEAAK